jgi:uncharacterized membrane protein YgaE (UPF0421/DUF939 family)
MPHKSGALGIFLILLAIIFFPLGAVSLWLGANGIVINNPTVHFGPTTTAEVNTGWIMISVSLAFVVIFLVLFFFKPDTLKTELPHYP